MAHINDPGHGADPHVSPGGDVHGHGVRAQSAAVHHEVTDIPLNGLTRAAAISVVVIGVVMLLMWGTWGFFLKQQRAVDPGRPPMAAEDFGDRLPATPRLQSVPESDLAAYRAEQAAKLEGLDWVDQSAGTVRIPIGAAMQLIVNRADTFADPQAKVPAVQSWSEPGAAQMERAGQPAAPPLPEHSPSPVPSREVQSPDAAAPSRGAQEKPQQGTTAPSEQDKPQAPPHE